MKNLKSVLLSLLLLILTSFQSVKTIEGTVVGVSDGDTIDVLVGVERTRIRLAEIDAPEKSQDF